MKGCRPLSPVEIGRVLRACQNEREKALLQIGIGLGLRCGELVSLRWADVWQQGRVLPFVYLERATTKNKKARSIPVNDKVASEIKRLRRESRGEFLFPGRDQGHISVRHANRVLGRIFDRAGLTGRLGTHCMRKSFGSILADQGVGLHVIAELMGHASISTTRAYLGVGVKNMRDAVRGLSQAY